MKTYAFAGYMGTGDTNLALNWLAVKEENPISYTIYSIKKIKRQNYFI